MASGIFTSALLVAGRLNRPDFMIWPRCRFPIASRVVTDRDASMVSVDESRTSGDLRRRDGLSWAIEYTGRFRGHRGSENAGGARSMLSGDTNAI